MCLHHRSSQASVTAARVKAQCECPSSLTNGSGRTQVSQTVMVELRSLTNGRVRTQVSQTVMANCEVSQTNSSQNGNGSHSPKHITFRASHQNVYSTAVACSVPLPRGGRARLPTSTLCCTWSWTAAGLEPRECRSGQCAIRLGLPHRVPRLSARLPTTWPRQDCRQDLRPRPLGPASHSH